MKASGAPTVVITGAAEGIGRSLALIFAREGWNVAAADIDLDRLSALESEIAGSGSLLTHRLDVSVAQEVAGFAEAVFNAQEHVDLLINNAGIESVGYLWETSVETWRRVQGVNVDGVFYSIREFLPRIAASGRPSHIVNVASVASVVSSPRNGPYGASKHAVQGLTETLYVECAEKYPQIRVSIVNPAAVSSRIFQDALDEGEDASESARLEREAMRAHLAEHGISADEAAERIREGIASGDFWIATHPERLTELARRRAEFLTALASPTGNIAQERMVEDQTP